MEDFVKDGLNRMWKLKDLVGSDNRWRSQGSRSDAILEKLENNDDTMLETVRHKFDPLTKCMRKYEEKNIFKEREKEHMELTWFGLRRVHPQRKALDSYIFTINLFVLQWTHSRVFIVG